MASDSQAAPQLCSGCTHPTQTGTRHAARMQSMLEDAGAAPGSLPGLGCRGRGAQVAPGPAPVHQEVRADSGGWTAGAQGQARPWGTGLRHSSSSQHSSACGGAGQEGRPVVLQGAGGVLPSRKLWVAEPGRTHPGLNSTAARAWDSPAGQVPSLAAPGTFSWPQGPCGLSRPCCHMWTSWEPGLWAQRTPGQTLALPVLLGHPCKSLSFFICETEYPSVCVRGISSFANTDQLLPCAKCGTWLWGGLSATWVCGQLAPSCGHILGPLALPLCPGLPGVGAWMWGL